VPDFVGGRCFGEVPRTMGGGTGEKRHGYEEAVGQGNGNAPEEKFTREEKPNPHPHLEAKNAENLASKR